MDDGQWERAGLIVDGLSGLFFLALAMVLVAVRPRRLVNVGAAVFAFGMAGRAFLQNLAVPLVGWLPHHPYYLLGSLMGLLVPVGLALVVAVFPHRWRWRPAAVAVSALAVGATVVTIAASWSGGVRGQPLVDEVQSSLRNGAIWLTVLSFAVLHGRETQPAVRRQLRLLSLALLLFAGTRIGVEWVMSGAALGLGLGAKAAYFGVFAPLLVTSAVLWARAARGRPEASHMTWWVVGPAAIGLCAAAIANEFVSGADLRNLGLLGLARIIGVGVFAYGILRLQLFDIDLKLKFALRQSTVFGIVLAVFFVVSELAAEVFSTRVGPYVGIVGAGALVFVIAPLQRVADRFSDRAMPHVHTGSGAYAEERKRETYRNALAVAWQDGLISATERTFLRQLRQSLDLPAQEYDAIEQSFEEGVPVPMARRPPRPRSTR